MTFCTVWMQQTVWRYNNSQTPFLSELLTILPFWSTLLTELQQRFVLTVSHWISVNISCGSSVCNDGVFSLHWALLCPLNSPIPDDSAVKVVIVHPLDCWGRWFESLWRHCYWSTVLFMCCVISGLWDGLVTCTEESCRLCVCLIVCDLETSTFSSPGHNWLYAKENLQLSWLVINCT